MMVIPRRFRVLIILWFLSLMGTKASDSESSSFYSYSLSGILGHRSLWTFTREEILKAIQERHEFPPVERNVSNVFDRNETAAPSSSGSFPSSVPSVSTGGGDTVPTISPTVNPTAAATTDPSGIPSGIPSSIPSGNPSGQISEPSNSPSIDLPNPSTFPSLVPSQGVDEIGQPSGFPSIFPSFLPSGLVLQPSQDPSQGPSASSQPSLRGGVTTTPSVSTNPSGAIQDTSQEIQLFLSQILTEQNTLTGATTQNIAFQQLLNTSNGLDPSNPSDALEITQRYSLNTLFYSTQLRAWFNSTGWTTAAPICGSNNDPWFGVICSEAIVIGLELRSNNLVGTLPNELGGLSNIQTIDLGGSRGLFGAIPSAIGQLTVLQKLVLDDNFLGLVPDGDSVRPVEGAIPTQLSSATALQNLTLSQNGFVGSFPVSIFEPLTNLQHLDVGINFFDGTIPTGVGSLGSLNFLDLCDNRWIGTIPSEIGQLTALTDLRIARSDQAERPNGDCTDCLNGPLPTEIGFLTGLSRLWLFENSLDGAMPSEIGRLTGLENLVAFRNQFRTAVPTEIGQLSNLTFVDLSQNFFGPDLPPFLSMPSVVNLNLNINRFQFQVTNITFDLPDIEVLQMEENFVSGRLPQNFFNLTKLRESPSYSIVWSALEQSLTTAIETLNFGFNTLTGTLPTELATFTNLQRLNLGLNFFRGQIPTEWAVLTQLDTLTLEVNALTGPLPTEMAGMSVLRDFEVADNRLNGTIPTELGLLTFLEDIELTNNTFVGTIPTELANLSRLQDLELDINLLTGTIPSVLGQISNLTQLFLQTNNFVGSAPDEICTLTTRLLARFITDCLGDTPEVVCICCSECRAG